MDPWGKSTRSFKISDPIKNVKWTIQSGKTNKALEPKQQVWMLSSSRMFSSWDSRTPAFSCPHYTLLRKKIKQLWYSTSNLELLQIVTSVLNSPESDLVQFLLDPSVHPSLISLVQMTGDEALKLAFYLTRTWCYSLHCEWMRLMKRFSFNHWIFVSLQSLNSIIS